MEGIPDLATIAVLAVILIVGWILLKMAFKLTATLFRIGCFIIFLIVGGALLLNAMGYIQLP
jgi:hypothetical protein